MTHHLRAMLSYFSGRLEGSCNGPLRDKLPRHISKYWPNIYGDTALEGSPEAYNCGYVFFGPDRMMYGTDYPFGANAGENFIRKNLEAVKAMDIPQEAKEKILGGNAKKLLKIE
jgi:aminocarboxymuconate-semialdehyde decarboxylase